MDTFIRRYTHLGVTYVRDDYNGTTMPAAVYDAIHTYRGSSGPIVDTSGVGWRNRKVVIEDGVIGRVSTVSFGTATVHYTKDGKKWTMYMPVDKLVPVHADKKKGG